MALFLHIIEVALMSVGVYGWNVPAEERLPFWKIFLLAMPVAAVLSVITVLLGAAVLL